MTADPVFPKRSPIVAYSDDPLTDSVHHPFTAFNQGYDAFLCGFDISKNPYKDKNGDWWRSGWSHGKEHSFPA